MDIETSYPLIRGVVSIVELNFIVRKNDYENKRYGMRIIKLQKKKIIIN